MNKNEIIKARFADFGIPFSKSDFKLKKGSKDWENAKLIFKENNFVIMGENYLKYCLKVAKLLLSRKVSTEIIWMNQSSLDNYPINFENVDVAFLIGVHKATSDYKSELTGKFINGALSKGKQVIIGASSPSDFEEAFPYELDQLEELFEIWSVK